MNTIFDLKSFEVSEKRGFLPEQDPLPSLPASFHVWEKAAAELPKLFPSDMLRRTIEKLPPFPLGDLKSPAAWERAMLLLSYLGHAYVWGERTPPASLPAVLAVPWYEVAAHLGRPPVLSYASYALHNWRRLDPSREPVLGNIVLLQNFLGGIDEEWFILIHIEIEYLAAPALLALRPAQEASARKDRTALRAHLTSLVEALERMYATLARMPEHCDPYVYYNRVRPYIHGWKDNPALPNGLAYKGVTAYSGRSQKFRGETGAQSSIIPCIDAVLGIAHKDGPLKRHLQEMRDYMPPAHRAFMEAIEQGPSVRTFVSEAREEDKPLRDTYNSAVTWVEKFRAKHLAYAASYIEEQKQSSEGNPTKVGTGGTPFMTYLGDHKTTTGEHLL